MHNSINNYTYEHKRGFPDPKKGENAIPTFALTLMMNTKKNIP